MNMASVSHVQVRRSSSTVAVRFRADYFSAANGNVTAYTLVLSEEPRNDTPARLPSWRDVHSLPVWPPYQVRPPARRRPPAARRSRLPRPSVPRVACAGDGAVLPVQLVAGGGVHDRLGALRRGRARLLQRAAQARHALLRQAARLHRARQVHRHLLHRRLHRYAHFDSPPPSYAYIGGWRDIILLCTRKQTT